MSKERILFVMHLPPPVHGASISNQNLFNSKLIKEEFDCDIINFQFETSIGKLKSFSIRKVIKSIYYAILILIRLIARRPDLIYYTISPFGFSFYRDAIFVAIIKTFRVKIVFHLHGKGVKKAANKNSLHRRIYAYVFNGCDIICLTKSLISDLEAVINRVPFIVPYGIPRGPVFGDKENICDPVNILYLSNFIKSKGILLLIDALELLHRDNVVFSARLVGAPSDLSIDYLSSYIKEKGLENNITVVGPRFDDNKFLEFHNADIFVFPTYYENETFGIVNLEAMQYKLPIISSYEGGIPEIVIENSTGFIINPKDINLLAEKLRILIRSSSLRKEMGENSFRRFNDHYTLEHFEKNMRNVFNSILQRA